MSIVNKKMEDISASCIEHVKGSVNGEKNYFHIAFLQVFPATGGEFRDPDVVISTTNRDP